jgi:hypothetical protein
MTDELNTTLRLSAVRISYPHLFEPKGFNGGAPKYSAKFLIPKTDTVQVKKVADLIKALAAASYKDKKVPPPDKLCMRDGDQTGKDEEAGHWIVSASESTRPVVVDRDRTPLAAEDDVIFPGCYVNATINLWAQDNQFGRRINANLHGVQFVKKGERLGGGRSRAAADEMFDEVDASMFADEGDGADDDNVFG